jgi:hypothetical protein
MGEVTARKIKIINQAPVEEFGAGGAMEPGEIARILVDENLPVRFEQIFRMAGPTEKYENLFKYLLRFETLSGRRLRAALNGKHEAEHLAQQSSNSNADEQAEIAQWFTAWVQNLTCLSNGYAFDTRLPQ